MARPGLPLKLFGVSALLLSAVVVTLYAASPWLRETVHLRWLTSDDPQRQRQAMTYLATAAAEDPGIVEAALSRIEHASDQTFAKAHVALDKAGRWTPEHVPPRPWLRWVRSLGAQDDPVAQLLAIDHLLRHDAIDFEASRPLLASLLAQPDVDVRLAAVLALGELVGAEFGIDPAAHELLVAATQDTAPLVRRHAWILLGMLSDPGKYAVDVDDPGPDVREAMLWARGEPSLLAPPGSAAEDVGRWRSILGLGDTAPSHDDLAALVQQFRSDGQTKSPLLLAALYRLGDPARADLAVAEQVLAALEGAPPGTQDFRKDADTPVAIRLAAVRANRVVTPDDLYPALRHDDATVRDRAAMLAADRLAPEVAADLADRLLREPDIESQMGGALLAGLLGVKGDVIRWRLAGVPDWPAGPVLELALWMQGGSPSDAFDPGALLLRDDVPRSTVLLAMLHRGDTRAALDALLAPHDEPMLDLTDLLVRRRWWNVLQPNLPEGMPPLWYWADARLTALQLDILRDAWVVRRRLF